MLGLVSDSIADKEGRHRGGSLAEHFGGGRFVGDDRRSQSRVRAARPCSQPSSPIAVIQQHVDPSASRRLARQ